MIQIRYFFKNEILQPAVVQSYRIQEAAGCFGNTRRGIAFCSAERNRLGNNSAELPEIDILLQLLTETARPRSQHDGIFHFQFPDTYLKYLSVSGLYERG